MSMTSGVRRVMEHAPEKQKGEDGLPIPSYAIYNIGNSHPENLLDFNTSCIMCHEQPSIEKLQRTGVVELDENNQVLGMEEKPQVPKSHWAVPPFYIYLKKDLDLVHHSVENGCGKDAPGNLAHYMVEHTKMQAWPMSAGRFDIGSLDTYYEAVEKYSK